MAIMIPSEIGYYDPASGEDQMFKALKESLSDDYYVFHSYRLVQLIPDKGLNENEIDFLVFNPNYGCLFIECKNGRIYRREDGSWYRKKTDKKGRPYEETMHNPFDQAFSGYHNLFNRLMDLYDEPLRGLIKKCKTMVAVWLPSYTQKEIDTNPFGPSIVKEIIMTKDTLSNKEETRKKIEFLMERMKRVHLVCKYEEVIEDSKGYQHLLDKNEGMELLRKVLCPAFKSIVNIKDDYQKTYYELLEEQYAVLYFLKYQRTAAISGASGTGKTLVAVQRARELSNEGKSVLFLCYNRNLMEDLERKHKKELKNVVFSTLDSLACKKCNTDYQHVNYYDLKDILENEMLEGTFEYQHIIVDEGQDFGKRKETDSTIKSDLLELFSAYGAGDFDNKDTSFFVFYDKNQLVNTKVLPVYLQTVDSKLTLYKNCRNTKNIAKTAYSLIDSAPCTHDRAWDGDLPIFIFYQGEEELYRRLDNTISDLSKEVGSKQVIISCSDSMDYSGLKQRLEKDADGRNYLYKSNGKKTRTYTCPTFKGLEADDVIVVDVSNKTFDENNYDFYVSTSRAIKRLYVFIDKDKLDVEKVLNERFPKGFPLPDKQKQFALAMGGVVR